jgi:hypothetical protein
MGGPVASVARQQWNEPSDPFGPESGMRTPEDHSEFMNSHPRSRCIRGGEAINLAAPTLARNLPATLQ